MLKLIGIVGTNSEQSTNRKLLEFIQKHFAPNYQVELIEISQFPLFNKPNSIKLPDLVLDAADKINQADGVIISTPEYDHSVPASLLNALAWLSYGIHPLLDKPVLITGASYGTLGSSRAQGHLRQILDAPEIKARLMPSSEFLLGHSLDAFDGNGNLRDADKIEKLEQLMKDFVEFVEIMKQLRNSRFIHRNEVESFSWDKL